MLAIIKPCEFLFYFVKVCNNHLTSTNKTDIGCTFERAVSQNVCFLALIQLFSHIIFLFYLEICMYSCFTKCLLIHEQRLCHHRHITYTRNEKRTKIHACFHRPHQYQIT